jgi:hypothetical protein
MGSFCFNVPVGKKRDPLAPAVMAAAIISGLIVPRMRNYA